MPGPPKHLTTKNQDALKKKNGYPDLESLLHVKSESLKTLSSEISQVQKNKYCMYDFTYMRYLE